MFTTSQTMRRIGAFFAPLLRRSLLCIAFLFASHQARADVPADLFASAANGSQVVIDHSTWDGILGKYVKRHGGTTSFDYKSVLPEDRQRLKHYISQLESVDPATLDRPEQFALLANLYNAKTIDIILDHYPVASIKDISLGGGLVATFTGGPWKKKVTKLRGVELSLDDIEHGILRPVFHDPRVHYALNCASIGCPNLQTEAFTGAKLEKQLDGAARDFINDPNGVDASEKALRVSEIYRWFKEDFGGADKAVITHLRSYASDPLSKQLSHFESIDGFFYNWRLNDADH
ncbi:DUF547 domain-containing protein [Hyphomicrobium sp.]|uniref:DUF547 domain-containing protein n=1 Tax=Hyphomicrobium sp. TaxID=82 RepID=UPI001DE4A377|nr:DUF547 domain-containing protein [Hyphomicrobium sp.]MBY0560445.1 DUF547 domain-containing protein [Hyphomicrobium sp.]